jgi:hypothetical protein
MNTGTVIGVRCERCGREAGGSGLPLPVPGLSKLKRCASCKRHVCQRCVAHGWLGGQVACKDCTPVRKG